MSDAIETQGTLLGIKLLSESASLTFDASANTITRAAGDFTTSYVVGQVVFCSDADNAGPYVVTTVAETVLTVTGVRTSDKVTADPVMTTDAVAASFALTVYTPIGEVVDFDGPGGSSAVIDRTHLRSTAKEKLMGLPDEGQFTFNLNHVPSDAGQVAFKTARKGRTEEAFALVFADETDTTVANWATFAGFALSYKVSGGVEAKVGASATIEITGSVTWSDE